MKTSQHQFDLLVTFMEEHGDLNKPLSTARGRIQAMDHCEELTSLLNSDGSGDTKTTEKWKKVWSDFKNNTKKKAARLHRAAKGTGGGPAVFAQLSSLEQRVLNVIGTQAATGLAIAEAGFLEDTAITRLSIPMYHGTQEEHTKIDENLQPWNEPGPSRPIHIAPPSSSLQDPHPSHEHEETRQNPVVLNTVMTPASPQQTRVSTPRPVQPQSGQTTPRRSRRPTRPTPRRHLRTQAGHTDQAAAQFLSSDAEWREFRRQQHHDYIEMKREQNRIRELEVQTQREWQNIESRTLDILEKLVNKFCKD